MTVRYGSRRCRARLAQRERAPIFKARIRAINIADKTYASTRDAAK